MTAKTAVVLFNLGGPDGPEAVRPFLFNLFNDPAILRVPKPVRWVLARLIARRRAPTAQTIYRRIGGKSPLLEMTNAQAAALERALGTEARVFVAMRYWHPFAAETAHAVKAYAPDRIVLLPLYPQYSTTTSASSLADWQRAAQAAGLAAPTHAVCCYPDEAGWIAAQAGLLRDALPKAAAHGRPRVLFSAHGLPKRVVEAGDPYQWQVERTAAAVVARSGPADFDWLVSYQSRVGPLEWIGPATDDEIRRAGRDGVPLVVVPIAFVSEHSETLVELDIEYRELAHEAGVPAYVRVPAVGTHPAFVDGLAALVRAAVAAGEACRSGAGARICPGRLAGCPCEDRRSAQ